MGEVNDGTVVVPRQVSGGAVGFEAARMLIEQAETDAGRLVAQAQRDARDVTSEADRYVRARRQEADMLVARARRLLVAAEEKAAVIIATARTEAADGTIDLRELPADGGEVGRFIAPGASRLHAGALPSRLDRMLASAIAHAVEDAFAEPIEDLSEPAPFPA
jgi:hypothetical protein